MDDVTLGELYRRQSQFSDDLKTAHLRIDRVQQEFVRRDNFDVAIGSFRIEIHGLQEDLSEIKKEFATFAKDAADFRRNMMALVITAFVGPIVTALVVFYMTQGK
jgi:hypothetical protein